MELTFCRRNGKKKTSYYQTATSSMKKKMGMEVIGEGVSG